MAQIDSWMREFEDAVRLSDDIATRVAERNSSSVSRPAEASRLVSLIRRKLTMLGTKLDSLQSLLSNPSLTKSLNEKDLNKRQEMVLGLRTRMNQMATSVNSSQASNRSNLLGHDGGQAEPKENNRTSGLNNSGIIGLQRQIMREQDEDLVKLEETVMSTKHIALAVNEELDLHTKLLDELDQDVDVTNNRLKVVQRRLGLLSKKASSNCSLVSLLLMALAIVILVLVIFSVIRYL